MGRAAPRPCLALLRVGFAMRPPSPEARCALTAPFHPYLCSLSEAIGGLLSAALSVGFRRPGVTRHPALWSSDFPPRGRSRGPLGDPHSRVPLNPSHTLPTRPGVGEEVYPTSFQRSIPRRGLAHVEQPLPRCRIRPETSRAGGPGRRLLTTKAAPRSGLRGCNSHLDRSRFLAPGSANR